MNEPAAAQPAASLPSVSRPPPPSTLGALERRVTRLQTLVASWRLLWGFECLLAVGLLVLALVGMADQLVRFDQDSLCKFSMIWWGSGLLVLIGLGVWVWRHTPGRGLLALHLEARERAYAGHLLTAVEALERPGEVPAALAEFSAEQSWRVLKQMPSRSVCPSLHWRAAHLALTGSVAVLVLGFGLFGVGYWRSVWDAAFPGPSAASAAAQLNLTEVRPGNAEIGEGESLAVEALCEGTMAGSLVLQVRDANGRRPVERELKAGEAGAWQGRIDDVRKPCQYRVVAFGNASAARRAAAATTSTWFNVSLRPAQALRSVAVLVEPPAYTALPAHWMNDPEMIEAPAQSAITLLIKAVPASGLSVAHAEVPGGGSVRLDRLADEGGVAQFRLRFVPERSGLLRLGIAAAQKERADVQTLLPISLVGDRVPDVAARIPDGALADAEGLPVDLCARDDYGLTAARLVVRRLREGVELSQEATRETRFDVPLSGGIRALDERWIIPHEGLDEWLSTGFEYRLEAEDNAQPKGQLAQSPWLRYEPHKRSQAQAEPSGLFDPPKQRRPRQLARGNALSNLPNPTPEELAQMKGLGDGVDAPRQLRRPQAERLDDGARGSGSGSSGGGGGKASGAPKSGEKDRYDLPQGLPKDQEKEKPKPGGETGKAAGGKDKGQDRGQGQGQAQGKGEPEGGEPRSGQHQPKDKEEGPGKGEGQGTSQNGPKTAEGGDEEDAGGALGSSQTQPGSGPGGRQERDGGPKTGREAGAGSGPMAPPDVATLARMKGLTPEEAEAYARQHGIAAPASGFGARTGGRTPRAGEQGIRQEMGRFAVKEAAAVGSRANTDAAQSKGESVVRLSWGEIDPVYQPSVEGYFQRWDEWRSKK